MTKPIKAKTSVNNGWVQPKPRKRRKPMTPEQKVAAEAELANHEGYVRMCNTYLRNGDWCDNCYGEHQEKRIKWQTIVPKG